jgi:hypothetical protein
MHPERDVLNRMNFLDANVRIGRPPIPNSPVEVRLVFASKDYGFHSLILT